MRRIAAETRDAILDSAEREFAIHGAENASLRDIAVRAGQRNNSAVQYHFGDRDGLVAAVFARSMDAINTDRIARLAELGDGATAADLVEILLIPLVDHVERTGGWYGRFLARNRFDRIAREVRGGLPASVVVRDIGRRLTVFLPDVPRRVRNARLEHVMNHYTAALASWEWARDRGEPRPTADELRAELLATCTAMVLAQPIDSRKGTDNKGMSR